MVKSFGIIGGDQRQAELARLLEADHAEVRTYGLREWSAPGAGSLERAAMADVILLPLPLCGENGGLNCKETSLKTGELFCCLNPRQRIFAGRIGEQQRLEAERYGLKLEDYFCREELIVANAAATAEAAIRVAMEQLDETLLGMECLVLGFGRIGKLLCHRLAGMGAKVTATARKPGDLSWIRAYGFCAEDTWKLDGKLGGFGLVFNTVPVPVLDAALLSQLKPECLCIDLASRQGIDLAAAEGLGLPNLWATGLPGRMVPRTAARVIRDTIYHMLSEGDSE